MWEGKSYIQVYNKNAYEFIDEDFFSTVIYFKDKNGGSIGGMKGGMKELLTKRQYLVFSLIDNNNKITIREIANELNVNRSAVQKHIENLKKYGLIKRIGAAKGGYWKIIDK